MSFQEQKVFSATNKTFNVGFPCVTGFPHIIELVLLWVFWKQRVCIAQKTVVFLHLLQMEKVWIPPVSACVLIFQALVYDFQNK